MADASWNIGRLCRGPPRFWFAFGESVELVVHAALSLYFAFVFSSLSAMTSLDAAYTLPSPSSFASPELFTPAPSHSDLQQVPDVFVTPPEEEHHLNPPFCYFDAAMESRKNLAFLPDMDALDVALGFTQQTDNRAPIFHRTFGNESQDTIVMPRRGGRGQDVPTDARSKRVLDEDVVEVVKVRKTEGVSNSPDDKGYALKKSKTFRARASQAFRSIKNVGKGSGAAHNHSHRKALPESWAAAGDRENHAQGFVEHGVLPRTATPTMGCRKSVQLSQMFSTRGRSPAPDVPLSPTSPTSSEWSALSRPSLAVEECMNPSIPTPEAQEQPALSKRRSFVRRISVLDLHRLFSPTTPVAPKLPAPSMDVKGAVPPSPSRSPSKRDSLPILQSTSSGLSDDVFSSSMTARPHSFHASATQSTLRTSSTADAEIGDTSLDLQLDSLHFDSLHFDPEEFQ